MQIPRFRTRLLSRAIRVEANRVVGTMAIVLATVLAGTGGCSPASKDTPPGPEAGQRSPELESNDASSSTVEIAPSSTPPVSERPVVLFFGTSLTAGYGLDADQAYPALIEKIADSAGLPIVAANLGLSGETSAGALRRVDWILNRPVDIVVLETGANDALRGSSVRAARANIEAIVDRIKERQPNAAVLLVQMEAPPNLGTSYTRQFRAIYQEIAKEKGVALAPFLLDGVAGNPDLNLADGIHPNAGGARIVAQTIWHSLRPLVAAVKHGKKR